MQFSITDNTKGIAKRFNGLRRALGKNGKSAMTAAALQATTIIKLRTAKGVDVDGKPFTPYTKAYAAFKVKKGRGKGQQIMPPNLIFSGNMLASMMVKKPVTSTRAEIFFNKSESAKKAAFNNERRRFFDLSSKELDRIRDVYFRRLTGER